MLRTLKWVYWLGARHERMRIKNIMLVHRSLKPEISNIKAFASEKDYLARVQAHERALSVWYEVDATIRGMIEPDYNPTQQVRALIDEEIV